MKHRKLIKHFFDPIDNRGGAGTKHAKRTMINGIAVTFGKNDGSIVIGSIEKNGK